MNWKVSSSQNNMMSVESTMDIYHPLVDKKAKFIDEMLFQGDDNGRRVTTKPLLTTKVMI